MERDIVLEKSYTRKVSNCQTQTALYIQGFALKRNLQYSIYGGLTWKDSGTRVALVKLLSPIIVV